MTDSLPKERLDELNVLAGKATPGPWSAQEFDTDPRDWGVPILGGGNSGTMGAHLMAYTVTLSDSAQCEADADFITALDPDTVRALIADARRAQEAEAKLEQVRAWRDDPRNRTTGRIGELDTILDQAKEGK